jgi:DNA-binding transcriptional regulator YbjK
VGVKSRDGDRKELLADAAIDVIGGDGLRALTHRAVDTRAGLPQGTCSYHYPSRRALLAAVLERIAALDRAEVEQGPELATVLTHWLSAARVRTRARLILMLDPEARAELAGVADRLASGFVDRAAEVVGDRARARRLVGLLDGLAVDELIRGDGTPPTVDEVRAYLRAAFHLVDISPPE